MSDETVRDRRWVARVITGVYVLSGVAVLAAFLKAPPDGLANVWVALWVLPVTALGWLQQQWTGIDFPFTPRSLGYYRSHVVYFVPALTLCACLLHRLIAGTWK